MTCVARLGFRREGLAHFLQSVRLAGVARATIHFIQRGGSERFERAQQHTRLSRKIAPVPIARPPS